MRQYRLHVIKETFVSACKTNATLFILRLGGEFWRNKSCISCLQTADACEDMLKRFNWLFYQP